MIKKIKKIEGTDEAWESRELGADEDYVESVKLDDSIFEEAIGLQAISIRLPVNLLEDLKLIASLNGLGYQPLTKQILKRFVECEKKKILREAASRRRAEIEAEEEAAAEIIDPVPKDNVA